MKNPSSVLVVGASLGGLSVVEALRREGYAGAVTLLGAERHLPYDRPPLSKKVLSGAMEPEKTLLRSESAVAQLNAEVILGDAAIRLDLTAREVHTATGRTLRADVIVLATGLVPRRLPGQESWAGVHVLRTMDESMAMRADLLKNPRLVVVGDGVLGTEIAATARSMGLAVTLTGPQPAPLGSQLGPLVGGVLAKLHTEKGVDLRLGVAVQKLIGGDDGHVSGVLLDNGEVLPAEMVVVAIGAHPVTDWLADSGLDLANGIVCDVYCRAAEGVYAVGDIASFYHEGLGARIRLENRSNAVEQAATVAANIVGKDKPYTPVPFFWTDQYETKIQAFGFLLPDAEVAVVEGDLEKRQFVALYGKNGKVIGALGWNALKTIRSYRQLVVDGAPIKSA